jgi:hypothetical protein
MNRANRAAGIAAATAALFVAVSFSAPSQAENTRSAIVAPVQPGFDTPIGLEAALDRVETQVIPGPKAVEPKKGVVDTLWTKATSLLRGQAAPTAGPQQPKSLDELVQAYAGDSTESEEQDCLAKAVYFEARGEPIEGQLAVAQVVLNRADSGRYPATLCEVVTQPWQFSFIRKGRFPTPDFGSEAWRKAVAIARIAQSKLAGNLPSNVLWYHATYVSPSWGKRLHRTAQIGLHIFYS